MDYFGIVQSIPNHGVIVQCTAFKNSLEPLVVGSAYRILIRVIYWSKTSNNCTNELFKILQKILTIEQISDKKQYESVVLMKNQYEINNSKIAMNERYLLLIKPYNKYYNKYTI